MSFQDVYRDLEAGLPPPPPPPPPAAVVAHCEFQINTKVTELRRLAESLAAAAAAAAGGAGGDTGALRERIRRARAEVTRLARNTARRLADPAAAAAVGPNLAMDFEAVLREFQWVQGLIIAADRQQAVAAAAAARRRATPSYDAPPSSGPCAAGQQRGTQTMQQQQLVESRRTQELALLDSEITFNEALVQDREREICKIQQEIAEVNEIFRDLAKLIHGQQEAIDVVESNLQTAAMETSRGQEQLSSAAVTQEADSSTQCLMFTALGLIMLIFVVLFIA